MDTSVECTIAVGELDNILVDPQLIILTFGVVEACTLRSAFPLFKMSSCPEGIRIFLPFNMAWMCCVSYFSVTHHIHQ